MKALALVRRLEALTEGRPLPVCTKLHTPRRSAAATFVCVFVRAGGEARPWGVAWGCPDQAPKFAVVAEPLDREPLAAAMAEFGVDLLRHCKHPAFGASTGTPHVWTINGSHLEMMHCLAFNYAGARRGPTDRVAVLRALGRTANWLFQETRFPDQPIVIEAATVLREHFAIPADPFRQQHLGYLMAQLSTPGTFEDRERAGIVAEQQSVSTSLTPSDEDQIFEEHLEPLRAAKDRGDARLVEQHERAIIGAIEDQLRHRYELVCQAWRLLQADGRAVSAGVAQMEEAARFRFSGYVHVETKIAKRDPEARSRGVETDRWSVTAARKFLELETEHDRAFGAFVHDDDDALVDAVAGGDAFHARVTSIRDDGAGTRKRIPVWTVDDLSQQPIRLRVGDKVCLRGAPKLTLAIRQVREGAKGGREIELEVVGGKTSEDLRPLDEAWWRTRGAFAVVKAVNPDASFPTRKNLGNDSGPGTWLTRCEPPRFVAVRRDDEDEIPELEPEERA